MSCAQIVLPRGPVPYRPSGASVGQSSVQAPFTAMIGGSIVRVHNRSLNANRKSTLIATDSREFSPGTTVSSRHREC